MLLDDESSVQDKVRLMPQSTNAAPPAPFMEYRDVSIAIGGKPVLANISLGIGAGEFVCMVGPSGCGKTTLLRVIAGLVHPTSGQVFCNGEPVIKPRQDIAIVFQDYSKALLPWRTAEGNVSLALEAMGVPASARKDRVGDLLELIGLHQHRDKYPNQLSGGMQQRLQIARCLAQEPVALLMDEPFGALDAMTRQSLQDEILRIIAANGTTVLFVTHDLEEALYLGDRVVALHANPGRVCTMFDVHLPRPRNQLTTREAPEFLHLRRDLYDLIRDAET
jgi:NitT/TauT family transport system ATP-binding protein